MMNCTQFRESLDCYLDGELSAAASAAADAHRQGCLQCDRALTRLLALKSAVKQTVGAVTPPPDLDARVRTALTPRWLRPLGAMGSVGLGRSAFAVAALVVLAVVLFAAARPPVSANAANAMDRLALRLDDSSPVVLEGTVLCRDCELAHRYGIEASCRLIGHHGAIATADGRIWNIIEQRSSATLIHDESLLGSKVVVHGRLFRGARALVIESYELES
jgi:hypothetical protein